MRALAVARFADRVVLVHEGVRLVGLIFSREIDYLVGQLVACAHDIPGREPEGALAVRADAVYRGVDRVQAYARVREYAVLDDHEVAQDGHQTRPLQSELRVDDLDGAEVGERQVRRDIP